MMRSSAQGIALLALLTCLAACDSQQASTNGEGAEFEGFYASGFETSSFVPCPEAEAGYGKGYWLGAAPKLGFNRQYEATLDAAGKASSTAESAGTVYVRFIGDLSPPGEYGHLNQYTHEITVTEVLEMSLDGQCS